MNIIIRASWLLVLREFKRILKEPSRLMGILLQPLLFLLVFGAGFSQSFGWQEAKDVTYAHFFFPGVLSLVLLFSTIYSTLTLVEDKKCGLFRQVLISEAGLLGGITGKVLATALVGFCQSLLFLPLSFFLGIKILFNTWLLVILLLFLGSLMLSLLGVALAWISPTSSAFHALMSVLLLPMWVLSGAMFPLDSMIFKTMGLFNPMTYLVQSLRSLFMYNWLPVQAIYLILFIFLFAATLIYVLRKKPLTY